MSTVIYGVVCILGGAVSLALSYKVRTDEDFGRNYIRTSPRAFVWRKLLGEEKAYEVMRKVFMPIGLILSVVLISVGVVCLVAGSLS